jgi:hypothetical protein
MLTRAIFILKFAMAAALPAAADVPPVADPASTAAVAALVIAIAAGVGYAIYRRRK